MDPFRQQLILDLVRLGLAFGLFFVLVPRLLIALHATEAPGGNGKSSAGWISSATMYLVLVHVLVMLGVFDPLLYLGCVAGLVAMTLGLKFRGARALYAYAALLRLLESEDPRSRLRQGLRRLADVGAWFRPSIMVACALMIAVVLIRARPFWESVNPSSFTFYAVLDEVKSLEAGQIFPGGVLEERGLHAFALALHTFSQVGAGPVVLLIGLISVLLLVYVIFDLTTALARSRSAGITAVALFGIVGLWWPPLGPEIHTQADPLPLASAFLLAALYFAARYVGQGRRPDLLVAGAALVSSAMTSVPAAEIGCALLAFGSLAYMLLPRGRLSYRAPLVSVLGSGALLGFIVATRTGPHLLETVDPYRVPRFEVVMNSITPAAIGGPDVRTAVFLSSVFACIAAGLLLAPLWRATRRRAGRRLDTVGRPIGVVAGCLLIAGSIWTPVPLPLVNHDSIQPRGYAHAYAQIRRTVERGDWTVVGHEGLRVQVKNDGFFMGYDEFLGTTDPDGLLPAQGLRSSTRDTFVFVDLRPYESPVRAELHPPAPETSRSLQRLLAGWTARTTRVSVFYEDRSVRVYRIQRPPASTPHGTNLAASYGGDR